ncbi:hypothetical protein [Chryseobacterium sp. MMS23-Vi53]|uniref:hypothetical protein n=1 Tax=Chryseobacterium sp. MMS23-Vi53 TaxID=3386644 RepID=UPI0039E7C77A
MKTFAKNDFYIQLSLFIIGLITVFLGIVVFENAVVYLFYFIVGIPQLISFIIRAFQEIKKSWLYIVYGIFIIPVWISWLIILAFNNNNEVTNVLIASIFYSPFLAIIYVYDTYEFYKSQK